MKRFLALGTAVLMLTFLVADEASARRGGGGVRVGGGFGGFRAANVGGFRGAGFRAASFGGWRGGGWGIGRAGWSGAGASWAFAGRPGWGVGGWRGAGWRGGGWGWAGRPLLRRAAWNRGWGWGGWGFPLAAAAGFGLYSYASSDCTAWTGYRWVNVCYSNYPYGYW